MAKQLTIGQLAQRAHVSTDTLRYYEKMKLLSATTRSRAGYRLYDPETLRVIRFINGAKALNFTLTEIRSLLTLDTSDQASCAEVVKQTEGKIIEAEQKIAELKEIKKVLNELVKQCPGDTTSAKACPILEHLKGLAVTLAAALAGSSLWLAGPASAKPISYVGGTMIMQENDETGSSVAVDYTITPRYAAGFYAKQERGGKDIFTYGPQVNTLIKRWNLPHGQGNIFNSSGLGVGRFDGRDHAAAWTGFLADYETRRIFGSYEAKFSYIDNVEKAVWQRARVGVSPYLANYDDISSWLMLQVDHHPAKNKTLVVTPLLRLFYKTTLVEAGYSSNNHLMFNWILQL